MAKTHVEEMQRAAEIIEAEAHIGICAGGFPIAGDLCEFCGATWKDKCKRAGREPGYTQYTGALIARSPPPCAERTMPDFSFDDCPSRELMDLRRAWRDHYTAKGCSSSKAFWLAAKKTHTWPPAA